MSDTLLRPLPKINGFALQRPPLLSTLLFAAVLLGLSLFFVWSRLQVTHLEYDVSSLQGRLRALQQESNQLRLEAASLRSPARLEQVAVSQLGLRFPAPEQVITVD